VNIEYLEGGTEDYPLIRIYGDEPDSVKLLMASISDLVNGKIKQKCINDINGFNSINDCQFSIEVSSKQEGVIKTNSNSFKCLLPKDDWQTAYMLLEPLSKKAQVGYQWIDETSNISFLVSLYEDGQW
jgi:hypothetical protein